MPANPVANLLQLETMRTALLLLFCCTGFGAMLAAADREWTADFEGDSFDGWAVPLPDNWLIAEEDGNKFLRLGEAGPIGAPRRPVMFAVWEPGCVADFVAEVKVRRKGRSLLIAFGFQDRLHYYYAHISSDNGDHAVHNGLFKVDGGERFRIAGAGSAPALPTADWHHVRIIRETESGRIDVFMDGDSEPRFHVFDRSFAFGRVGIGSFDETGDFDDFRLQGEVSGECQADEVSALDPQ